MKILFSADQHLNLHKKGVKKDWLYDRFLQYTNRLLKQESDILILGGDFFDKRPQVDEVGVFLSFIDRLDRPTYIISGNHCMSGRNTSFLYDLATISNKYLHFVCKDEPTVTKTIMGVPITFLDYIGTKKHLIPKPICKDNILVIHARCTIEPFIVEEYPLKELKDYKCVLAGDIHIPNYKVYDNIYYPGSPMSVHFGSKKEHGVFILDTTKTVPDFIPLDLPSMIKLKVDKVGLPAAKKIKATDTVNIYQIEVTGSVDELAGISDVKKVVETTINYVVKTKEQELLSVLEGLKIKDTNTYIGLFNEITNS